VLINRVEKQLQPKETLERYMYAVIDVGGRQLKVAPEDTVRVPRMRAEVGSSVSFDRVFAIRTEGDFKVGTPSLEGARVTATVVAHGKADKEIIFKYKKRKFYRRKRGHRQPFTEVRISQIVV
jgi:large subunit ribosomal protein L21